MSEDNPVQVDSWGGSMMTSIAINRQKKARHDIAKRNRIKAMQLKTGFCWGCYKFGEFGSCYESCTRFRNWRMENGNKEL